MNKHTLLKRIRTHRHWLVIMLIFIMQGIILITAYKEHAEYTKPTFEANKIEYIGYSDINQLHTYRLDGDVYITSHELITISIDGENEFIRDGETIMMPTTFPLAKSKELTWKSYGNKDDELRFVTIQRTLINAEKLNDKTEVNKDVEIRPISIKKVPLSIDEIIQRINRLTGEEEYYMNLTKEQKTNYLIQEFCCTDYEKEEMKKWINNKGLEFVYDYVSKTFKFCEGGTEK